ncbi:MAG: thioredoxin family protein [Gammaproteobacteria bacterium]|nr:thioredoxin family protein [Gammaproteobacteria bacterium]
MTLFVYAILGLAGTWGLYLAYMHIATRAAEGRSAQPLYDVLPGLGDVAGPALVYCFSPQCGPCRPMSKEVDLLRARGAPVFKLDITAHPEAGRELGIRATPTLIVVENGAVARMILGVKTADYMQRLLDRKRLHSSS